MEYSGKSPLGFDVMQEGNLFWGMRLLFMHELLLLCVVSHSLALGSDMLTSTLGQGSDVRSKLLQGSEKDASTNGASRNVSKTVMSGSKVMSGTMSGAKDHT